MGLQKKDGSRHAIGALAVIISSLFGARRLNPHTFVSTYSYLTLFTICYASVILQLMLQIP